MIVNILIIAVLSIVNYKLLEKLNSKTTVESSQVSYILLSIGLAIVELLLFTFFKVVLLIAILGGLGYFAYKILKK